jgi:F-type H+-transporting ATPase subunit gamma
MNLREVRKKIKSVSNVKKITKTMQLVSAIKMKKAQQAAVDARPYQESLEKVIKRVMSHLDETLSPLLSLQEENSSKKKLAIVIATNKGLCGAFNFNLFRFIAKNIDFDTTDFVIVGKKASSLGKFGAHIIANFSSNLPMNAVSAVFNLALNGFLKGTYSEIVLIYNRFISTMKNEPMFETIVPVGVEFDEEAMLEKERYEYLIEPTPAKIIDPLLRSFVETKIRYAITQTEAGEHSSRMIAMKNATDNANDVIYNFTLLKNKIRQEKITNELLDMVTAKESVEQN